MTYIVILTGGYMPATQSPGETDEHFSRRQHAAPETIPADVLIAARNRLEDAGDEIGFDYAVTEAWRAGWHEAAMTCRTVAAWVFGDQAEAETFAAWVTRTIDPAYVLPAGNPVTELLKFTESGPTIPAGKVAIP